MTKLSKVYFGFNRVSFRDAGTIGSGACSGRGGVCVRGGVRDRTFVDGGCGTVRLDEVGVHDHAEVADLGVDALHLREGLEDGRAHALVHLRRGEVVRDVEVESAPHDALRNGEVQEAVELRGDTVVGEEVVEHGGPDGNIRYLVQ